MKPRFLIVGWGRSGSGFIAKALTKCGVRTGHEEWFTRHTTPKPGLDGDSSWLAVPELDGFGGPVGLQVRDPLRVLSSLTTGDGGPYAALKAKHVPVTGDVLFDAVTFMVAWHRLAVAHAGLVWRVEDVDGPLLAGIARFFGHEISPVAAQAVVDGMGTTYNKHGGKKPVGWSDVETHPQFDDLRGIAAEYDYATP